jgi:hypothetical protein
MRIWIQILILISCGSGFFSDADLDADSGYQNDADPCGSGSGSKTLGQTQEEIAIQDKRKVGESSDKIMERNNSGETSI